jgi:FkbM family methyltransferase
MLKNALSRLILLLPVRLYVSLFNIIHFLRRTDLRKARVSKDGRRSDILVDELGWVSLPHPRRLALFYRGFWSRNAILVGEYGLDLIDLNGGIMIDIGANMGELAFWAKNKNLSYIGFEPDPSAFQSLSANLSSMGDSKAVKLKGHNIALGDRSGTIEFFIATESADSSFIRPITKKNLKSVNVNIEILDDYIEELGGHLTLLKIEAEGAEPEIISGGDKMIRKAMWISIDCGPERQGEDTAVTCLNAIIDKGFILHWCNLQRGVFLLKNTNLLHNDIF